MTHQQLTVACGLMLLVGSLAACSSSGQPPSDAARDLARDLVTDGRRDRGATAEGGDRSAIDRSGDLSCVTQKLTLVAEADACLFSGAADHIKSGKGSICDIGTSINSVGIFRFNLGSLATTAKIQGIVFKLAYAAKNNDCAPACGSCDSIEHGGVLALLYMRSDWPEDSVTWAERAYQDPALGTIHWDQAGASGPGDRSSIIGNISHVAKQGVVFDSAAQPEMRQQFAPWRSGDNRISLQVVPAVQAVFITATREQPGTGCPAPGYAKPTLELSYCP